LLNSLSTKPGEAQPMALRDKLGKLIRNLWRRVTLRQDCCGNPGEPGC